LFSSEFIKNNSNGNGNDSDSCLVKEYFRFRLKEREDLLKIITSILQKNIDLYENIKDLEKSIEKYYKFEEVNQHIKPNNTKTPKF